jgi:hypothetical protein|tara:strand:- start:3357 stop:3482 length:126 start_codon:yes stop_codon:yes gene_type:complete
VQPLPVGGNASALKASENEIFTPAFNARNIRKIMDGFFNIN